VRPELPNYSLDEVSKHKAKETRIWVTYGDGVYDITDFIEQHPGGGDKIILAAGGSLEPFWAVFAAHNTDEVRHILEEWRIGNISPEDRGKTQTKSHKEGPYANDPQRIPILKINTKEPFNAETPTVLLDNEFVTPNNLFFVRNHLPVPQVDPDKFVLEVEVTKGEPLRFTLDDLKTKFKQYTVTATIQCAGNRRLELAKIKPVKGLSWTGGAIGNATWTGVRLRDVLLYAGLKDREEYDIQHVHLEGLDNNHLTGERYGASVPVEKAMDIRGDCILAFEMNGEAIPRDHGYPLRAVIPGTVGARNVKWLTRVVASKNEYDGFWQQRDYKGFSPCIDWNNVDFSTAPAIQELPVQSLICTPQEGTSVDAEELHISGIAWSGGGRGVVRVDISADGGKTWQVANLGSGKDQRGGRAWAWTLWEATVPLPSKGKAELVCKAVDTSYNVQPDTSGSIWNLRGCLSNAWHRVHIHIK
jgi:sulfite oxidase